MLLLRFLIFECKTGGEKKMRVTTSNGKWIWREKLGMCMCAQGAPSTLVVTSFKSYLFWVMIPCWSANYLGCFFIALGITVFIYERHAALSSVLWFFVL